MTAILPYLIGFVVGLLVMWMVYALFKPKTQNLTMEYKKQNGNKETLVTIEDSEIQQIVVRETNADGVLEKELTLDSQLNGVLKFFYPSGQVNKVKTIQGMVAEGKATTYYPSGAVYIEDEYRNGALYKASVAYDENGNKIKIS